MIIHYQIERWCLWTFDDDASTCLHLMYINTYIYSITFMYISYIYIYIMYFTSCKGVNNAYIQTSKFSATDFIKQGFWKIGILSIDVSRVYNIQ